MRARHQRPSTKAELLRLKHELQVSREGLELLEHKRDSLMAEGLGLLKRAKPARLELTQAWQRIQTEWHKAQQRLAVEKMKQLAMQLEPLPPIGGTANEAETRRWMSVEIAAYFCTPPKPEPLGSITEVDICVEQVRGWTAQLLPALVELMNMETNIRRIAVALKQCHRKVNALTEVIIPELEQEKTRIEQNLEEKEREAIFQVKLLKARLL